MHYFSSDAVDQLFEAILLLKTKEECYRFFDDVCTIKEIQDMAQRLDAARLLDQGVSYQKISELVGASTATISRVSRCLHYGSEGYRTVLARLKEKNHEN